MRDSILRHSAAKTTAKIVIGALVLVWIHSSARQADDFDIFLRAASDLGHRNNIYAATYEGRFHYYYGVLFALFLQPFAALPSYWVKAGWLALNIVFVVRIWKLCSAPLQAYIRFPPRKQALWTIICIAGCSHFLRDNFQSCQLTICILWLTLEGLALLREGKQVAGATVCALAIHIKLLPLVIVPYLFYSGQARAGVLIVLFFLGSLALPGVVIGADYNTLLLQEWWRLINPTNAEHVIDVSEHGLHSLSTLLPIYLMPAAEPAPLLPLRRHIANLSADEVANVLLCARLLLVGFTLWFLRSAPGRKARNPLQELWTLSYILLAVPLIFPHQQGYAFFFAAPAIVWISACLLHGDGGHARKLTTIITAVLFCISLLAMNIAFWFDLYRTLFDHFKVLTFGALLLIVPLAMCSPHRLGNAASAEKKQPNI